MIKNILYIIITLICFNSKSQNISGYVEEEKNKPLIGANIYWINSTIGTTSDSNGKFIIDLKNINDKRLIISYIGFENDTISIDNNDEIHIILKRNQVLNEVIINEKSKRTHISSIDPIKTQVITNIELKRSSCCDLSGAFENESSVEPTITNIVTNSKELRILGLSGVYNQVLIDGMPLINGLSYTYGINSIPGTIINSIKVSKGANSVVQGYDGISGQINVQTKEPEFSEKILLNIFTNDALESQYNLNYSKKWNKWSSIIAAHSTQNGIKSDINDDNFIDMPLIKRYSIYNKWKYKDCDSVGISTKIGIRYIDEERTGGYYDYNSKKDTGSSTIYGQNVKYNQFELFNRTRYRFNKRNSIVIFASGFHQNQNSFYGVTKYNADQLFTNTILQYDKLYGCDHNLKFGGSLRFSELNENIEFTENSLNRTYNGNYNTLEQVPGLFIENSLNWDEDRIILNTGIRNDFHNKFGSKLIPRAFLKYSLTENSIIRISAGKAWRIFNLFSENINLLASSRDIVIIEDLLPEEAINYGINFSYKKEYDNFDITFGLDLYKTSFSNQIFPDYNISTTKAYLSNFTGNSQSNSIQADFGFEYNNFNFSFAYNYLSVYRVINNQNIELPFNSKNKINSNIGYKTKNKKWQFDANYHWYGKQLLTDTRKNPQEYQLLSESKPYQLINLQVTKYLNNFEVYLGCENVLNFKLDKPILSWNNPFGQYFDTSNVWGPIKGRELYLGIRYIIKNK